MCDLFASHASGVSPTILGLFYCYRNTPQDVKSFHRGITFGAGDFVALCSLFFDNLSTLLGFSGAILALNPTNACLQEILYRRIIPAAGIMLFLGNVYYSWMAIRMARKYQRAFTAQPYGFNTAGGFPFIFGIIYGVYYSHPCASEGADCTLDEENARIELAWKVCVSANFLTGVINIVLGFFGEVSRPLQLFIYYLALKARCSQHMLLVLLSSS